MLTPSLSLCLCLLLDSFVNSQEWTISRSVPDLRLGIVGSLNSGKSALVHRYLTGSYMQEESPEGGRFKKEVFIDGQSYLLLIRDEGGAPEMQVRWNKKWNLCVFPPPPNLSYMHEMEKWCIAGKGVCSTPQLSVVGTSWGTYKFALIIL